MRRSEIARFDAFLGIDVGKSSNCAVLLDRDCDGPLMRREVAQDEGEIRTLIGEAAELGELLVTVDQYGAFGRLAVAVARDMGVAVAHITPRKFKQVAETYGEGKSDAKDAFVIADMSRSQPRNARARARHCPHSSGSRRDSARCSARCSSTGARPPTTSGSAPRARVTSKLSEPWRAGA